MKTFFDAHADTASKIYHSQWELFKNSGHVDIERLNMFESPTQIFALYLKKECLSKAFENTNLILDNFENELEKNKAYIKKAVCAADIEENIRNKKISAVMSIEGGEALEGRIENIDYFYKRGVRLITLTWNYKNQLGTGAVNDDGTGLTAFGKAAVRKMQEKGIIVDVSHLNEKGFWDAAEIMEKPFAASHSNAKALCSHKRNLTDEQIKRISAAKGVIGINIYPPFVKNEGKCTIADVLKMTEYMLDRAGEDCVGIGCDFDGIDESPEDMKDVTSLGKFLKEAEKAFGREITEKIAYKNFLRIFREICG